MVWWVLELVLGRWTFTTIAMQMYLCCFLFNDLLSLSFVFDSWQIRSIEMLHKRFENFPEAFVKNLVSSQTRRCCSLYDLLHFTCITCGSPFCLWDLSCWCWYSVFLTSTACLLRDNHIPRWAYCIFFFLCKCLFCYEANFSILLLSRSFHLQYPR